MADVRDDAIGRLLEENARVHRENLDLLLRHSELIHENQQLWDFVVRAKRFYTFLQGSGYHSDSGEYIGFLTSFDRLGRWLREQIKALEPKAVRERA